MTLPQPIQDCFVVRQAGMEPYVHEYVNILNGGALYFVEDPGETIDFQVKSLLVEQGGILQAGSRECPFGKEGGTLSLGLYGDDPSKQGTIPDPPPGIECMTNENAETSAAKCFPAVRDPTKGSFYCTVSDSADPCADTTPPAENPNNFLLERYGTLNFDSTPWGYKALSVSYGGSLRLFGYKGAKPLQDQTWGMDFDSDEHCVVPTPEQSTLDAAEMRAWANLTGSSWVRLQAINDARTQLTLDRVVGDWAMGDEIVIGTTDWYPSHPEIRTVRDVTVVETPEGMRTQLTVDPLDYPHVAELFDAEKLEREHGAEFTDPVNRKAADLRAVVGLLSRSIQVRSLGDNPQREPTDPGFPDVSSCLYNNTNPDCYFGGQVMVRQGFREFQIQGAEFKQGGQGGRIGHYPWHFHLVKSTAYTQGKAFLKDSSVWDSMTRFVVVHGTHNVTVARNVGYLSVGHGYYIEDGSEIENLLCHNLGVSARAALEQYYDAQGKLSPNSPPLTARYVPPILDGVSSNTVLAQDATLRMGSDSYMPVMYWMMNAYNEFVGNHAVGAHGFGSCYWLLGSGVSGPSHSARKFDGLANYNRAGQYQAPLLRFRGNSCTTATYGLPASAELPPAGLGDATNTGYTAVKNPYLFKDGVPKTPSELMGKYDRPAVVGNFQPIQPNTAGPSGAFFTNCANTGTNEQDQLEPNTKSCVTTVSDRFTTSFNWAEVNFGSVWLRP